MKQTKFGLSASALRLTALFTMLVDHMGMILFPWAGWMRWVGRLSFPIFAFQIAEGYHHTHNFRRYCLRLLAFGLISEIPFNLMVSGGILYLGHQNVMFTLLLGLLAIHFCEQKKYLPLMLVLLAGKLLGTDYGTLGVATVLAFHLFRESLIPLVISQAVIHGFCFGGVQTFALAALIPIRLYNRQKGRGGKALQMASYLFYPIHMLILSVI